MKLLVVLFLFAAALPSHSWAQTLSAAAKKNEIDKKLAEGVDTSNRRQLTDQELLEKFFKKDPNQSVNQKKAKVYFPVFYESMGQPLTQIEVSFDSTIRGIENLKVDAVAVFAILDALVDPSWMPKIESLRQQCNTVMAAKAERKKDARDRGKVDNEVDDITCWNVLTNFSDENVLITFDEKLLEIRIKVKPEFRSVKIASLTNAITASEDVTHEPSWLSGYLNASLTQTIQSDNIIYKNGREPITGRYEGALKFGDLVFEAEARSLEKRSEVETVDPDFVREKARFVYDFPSFSTRMQVGDLTFPVGTFQTFRSMAGVSLFTKSRLKSSSTTLPGTNYDLNLARRSRVTVYINDQISQILDLPAGRHNLRDFPLTAGKNELKLEITDDTGRTEVQNHTVLLTNELLREGEGDFSYALGAPSTEAAGQRIYDATNQTMSLYHRYGFSQGLTLGGSYQADKFQYVGTLEFLFSTSIGYFSVIPAASTNKGHSAGNALKLRYTFEDLHNKGNSGATTAVEAMTTSSDFSPLGTSNPVNPTKLKLNLSHARSVSAKTSLNLSFTYDFNRESAASTGDSYSIAVGSGQRLIKDLSTNIGFRHNRGMTGTDDISVNFFLIWSFPTEKQFVTVSSGGTTNSRVDWTSYSVGGVGAHRARVNYQDKSQGPSYGGDIEYTANRATINASHQVNILNPNPNLTPPSEKKSVHTTNLLLGSALVFAGGKFAITKPVYDSFVIFSPLKNLNENKAVVNKQKDGSYIASTDWLGPAVANEIPSYYLSALKIDTLETQKGVSLPSDHFVVKPTYRSGYAIEIGTNATVYLKTKLLKPDGTPVSMIAAHAVYLDDTDIEPVTVFTNRLGLVRSEGFRQGKYRLDFPDDDFESSTFVIPDDASDEYELPALNLKASQK